MRFRYRVRVRFRARVSLRFRARAGGWRLEPGGWKLFVVSCLKPLFLAFIRLRLH